MWYSQYKLNKLKQIYRSSAENDIDTGESKRNLTDHKGARLEKYCAPDEYLVDDDSHFDKIYKNSRKLFSKKSSFQNIEVYHNDFYGNILVIDGDLQIT